VNTENEKAMRTLFDEWADKYGLPKEGDLKLVREDCYAAWQAALQSQVSNTDVLEKIVKVADEQPFCSIGHIVEHVVPEIRDALAAPKAPQQQEQSGEAVAFIDVWKKYMPSPTPKEMQTYRWCETFWNEGRKSATPTPTSDQTGREPS
jgi:hypothetical protein